jgi:hypothetical protein
MSERPQPDPVPVEDPPPHPAEPVKLETPVIDVENLELESGRTEKDDEAAIDAMEQLEQSLKRNAH